MKMYHKTKKSYGKCRCCLSKGAHRDLMKEYSHCGVREVYIEAFMDCFNLFVSLITTLKC